MLRLICLFAFLALASATPLQLKSSNQQCDFPNGTDTKFFAYNCDSSYVIQVLDQEVYDNDTGKPMYPVDVKRKILIQLDAQNSGDVYADNKVDVKIHQYSYSWLKGKCTWSEIPTFGLLNNIDGCDIAHNCPLQKGSLKLQLPLDLTNYASIIQFLAGDTPYQLTISMFDGNHKKNIACVVAQLKFAT